MPRCPQSLRSAPVAATAAARCCLRCRRRFRGMLALTALLAEKGLLADQPTTAINPLSSAAAALRRARRPSRVIFLFMSGGPSHLELFDPKPDLQRLNGQPLPESFGPVETRRNVARNRLLATRRRFRPCGQSGIEISDLLPHLARHADDLCVLRGCHGDSVTHPESVYQMNTGSILMGRPSLEMRGWPTVWAPKTRTCRLMWCCQIPPDWSRAVRPRGATAICLPLFRARCYAGVVRPCCT